MKLPVFVPALFLALAVGKVAEAADSAPIIVDSNAVGKASSVSSDLGVIMFTPTLVSRCTELNDIALAASGDKAANQRVRARVPQDEKHILFSGTKVYVIRITHVKCSGTPYAGAFPSPQALAEIRVTDSSSPFNGQTMWLQKDTLVLYQQGE